MKIKRFEAPSMSDALRMIKKEFGEEAVILSAKNLSKTSRIFGKMGGAKVIVTAAIDEAMPEQERVADESEKAWPLSDLSTNPAASAREAASERKRILERYTPITLTGQQKLRPKLVRMMSQSRAVDKSVSGTSDSSIYLALRDQGLDDAIASELTTLSSEAMPHPDGEEDMVEALAQAIRTRAWVAPGEGASRHEERRTIVLVGPNGSGKTATVAKLAASALMDEQHSVGILSLDNHRVAGTDELSRFADIMGLGMETAAEPKQVSEAFDRMADAQLIVVDTPGIAPDDQEGRQFLEQMIATMADPEVHLLLSAASQEKTISKMVRFFQPVGATRLLPTHLDWTEQIGPFVNQLAHHRLPMSYMSTGAGIPEGLNIATERSLAIRLLSANVPDVAASEQGLPITVVQRRPFGNESEPQYVANRNSDIFHRTDCKSVKRISNLNAMIFSDSAEALAQGFKPCRMCCSKHIVLKPIDHLARTRYASSRN